MLGIWRMELVVTRSVLEAMFAHAARTHPEECCGLLLGEPPSGRADLVACAEPTRNVSTDPACRFEIDPQALIDAHRAERAGGRALLGYYHSHPTGQAEPSATDRAQASEDGRIWAIVAGGAVGFWRDAAGHFEPLCYRVVDG
jgi:desampylase